MTMFVKLLLLKKTHTFFFFLPARDFLLHSFLQTAVPGTSEGMSKRNVDVLSSLVVVY